MFILQTIQLLKSGTFFLTHSVERTERFFSSFVSCTPIINDPFWGWHKVTKKRLCNGTIFMNLVSKYEHGLEKKAENGCAWYAKKTYKVSESVTMYKWSHPMQPTANKTDNICLANLLKLTDDPQDQRPNPWTDSSQDQYVGLLRFWQLLWGFNRPALLGCPAISNHICNERERGKTVFVGCLQEQYISNCSKAFLREANMVSCLFSPVCFFGTNCQRGPLSHCFLIPLQEEPWCLCL